MPDNQPGEIGSLHDYVLAAREHPALLANRLRQVPLATLCQRLHCPADAARRMLICSAPTAEGRDADIRLIAAYAGVDPARLAELLLKAGVIDGNGRAQWPRAGNIA